MNDSWMQCNLSMAFGKAKKFLTENLFFSYCIPFLNFHTYHHQHDHAKNSNKSESSCLPFCPASKKMMEKTYSHYKYSFKNFVTHFILLPSRFAFSNSTCFRECLTHKLIGKDFRQRSGVPFLVVKESFMKLLKSHPGPPVLCQSPWCWLLGTHEKSNEQINFLCITL